VRFERPDTLVRTVLVKLFFISSIKLYSEIIYWNGKERILEMGFIVYKGYIIP
jgi:hypothetical protein